MKATWDIPSDLLDNESEFRNDFYKRFVLRKAPHPLKMNEHVSKDYLFPTFYGDVSCAMAVHMCSYEKAASLLAEQLSPQIVPVRMTKGRALIAFSCYEYKKVLGVPAYNEIAIAIPVMVNPGFNPPVLPMIIDKFSRFGYYIAGMPVTSKENTIRGRRIWGLPKVTQDIDIYHEDGQCVVKAMDERGDVYLSLRIPMDGEPTEFDVSSYLYSQLDGKLCQSRTDFQATFNVKKNMQLLFRKNAKSGRAFLELGQTSFAPLLKRLEIEETPFQTRYAEHMSSCFDLPNTHMPGWTDKVRVSDYTLEDEASMKLRGSDLKIAFFGTGAIGASVGGWVAPHHENTWFIDQGKILDALKSSGITVYQGDQKEQTKATVPVKVIEDLTALKEMDVIIIGVKNYSLEAVAKLISEHAGNDVIIVSMANGIENQTILPRYFSRVIYCVVSYNAWMDEPVVVGYQKRGPLVLGTPDNSLLTEMNAISDIFNQGVETVITDHLGDAVHSKIVVNLTNSVTTLVGHGFREISDMDVFQKLLTNTLYEGVNVVKAAGYKECKLGGMPPWILFKASALLPQFITRPMFKKNVAKMVMSSMSQDIIQRGGTDSELDSLTGYIVRLARQFGVDAPYNETIYELGKERFGKPGFVIMDVKDVWAKVEERLK
ncbi:MAG TPA: 2-dehydropantoate 2-reductase [Deltaproteobacteria bacterium]|nr:2-dehydropantoate 2-reductase [Deltaproteobacteria bacterium]HPR51928.1 2-dehydropantoate 2-reductase [Deltaproteobacteria bacterium]